MTPPASDLTARALLRRLALLAPADSGLLFAGPEADRIRAEAGEAGWSELPEPRAALWFGPESDASDFTVPEQVVALGIVDRGTAVPEGFRQIRSRAHLAYIPLHRWLDGVLPGPVRALFAPLLESPWFRETVSSRVAKLKVPGARERWCVRGDGSGGAGDSAADRARDLAMSALGLGHLPLLAANWTSLATVLVAAAALWLGGESMFRAACLLLAGLATAGCLAFERWSARYYLTADAREVTLDEVAGMAVTLAFLEVPEWSSLMPPASLPFAGLALAFVLFRFFDIFKPGIHWVEKTGWRGTIVWDDLLAGLYAGVALRVLL